MRIPPADRKIIGDGSFRAWVDELDEADLRGFFRTIEELKRSRGRHLHESQETSWVQIAVGLSGFVFDQGLLEDYLDEHQTTALTWSNDDEFLRICRAAAWQLLVVYEEYCERGDWIP